MILPSCVISLYCNFKHLFETWKYLYKSGSSDDKCILAFWHMRLPHPHQGQKIKSQSHGAGAYCGGHLAAHLVWFIYHYDRPTVSRGNAFLCVFFWYCVLADHRKLLCVSLHCCSHCVVVLRRASKLWTVTILILILILYWIRWVCLRFLFCCVCATSRLSTFHTDRCRLCCPVTVTVLRDRRQK